MPPSRNLIIAVLGLCLLLAPACLAQSFNASISGTVTDPSGAAVPSAEVTLTSVETGSVAKTTSGQDGLYSFLNLQRGGYELDRKSTRLNSSHVAISYAVFCLK